VAPRAASGPAKATPSVRRHAHELDVDVAAVPGTGPSGRVTHADVEAFASGAEPEVAPLAPPALPQVFASGTETRVPIIGIRRRIAERMVAAKHTAPHFTYVEEVDCTELVSLRTRLKARAEQRGVSLSFLPFFAKACSLAFRDFPNVNAVMDEAASELVVRGDHHIGVSCDTPNGLMVPVVRNVEQKSILRIAADMQDLFARTKAGKASREELSGGTFTMTSVGSIGGVLATPILNVPEVAILGINQIRKRPVVDEADRVVVRHMTYLSPSFDHRIIDGAVAARFVARLKDILEHPEQLLLELV
jgi:pyruvate dehydrogenase E2 component (dihydrolipoamide acetyltransferase)